MTKDLHPNDWKTNGLYFSFRGFRVFFREQGTGPAMVCLHGFPTSSFDFAKIWEELPGFRLIAPDFMGFGFSFKSTSLEYSIYDQASLIEDLLRKLGIRNCYLLAHDYGATVAQELLARSQEVKDYEFNFLSVVWMNGGIFPDKHRARWIQKALLTKAGPLLSRMLGRKRFGRQFSAIFGEHYQPDEKELDAFWEIITHHKGHHLAYKLLNYIPERERNAKRWTDALIHYKRPMLFINGNQDPVSGKHMAEAYAERVADANVINLHDVGHYPQWEAPDRCAAEILRFLRELPTQAGSTA